MLLLAVHHCGDKLRGFEIVDHSIVALLEVLVVEFFGLLDQGVDDEGLPPLAYLALDEVVHLEPLPLRHVYGLHRLAARRQLVDDRHVQVSVEGHGQGPGDGRGRHH